MTKSFLLKRSLPQDPLHVRVASVLLFAVFIALLAGRFTLGRFSASLPDIDLRLVFTYLILAAFLVWLPMAIRTISLSVLSFPGGLLFFLWAGWLAASGMWSPQESRVWPAVLDMALMMVLTAIAWVLMAALPPERTSRIWKWLLIAGVIYFALAMASGPGLQGRYSAPGGGPNVFVRVMVLASLAALYVSIAKRRTWPLMAVPLFVVGAALSGSRGGILSGAVVMLLFLVPIAHRLGAKKVLGILASGAVVSAAVTIVDGGKIATFVQERYIHQTLVEGYSSSRDTIGDQAVLLYQQNPIGGAGIDGYYAVMPQFEYAHNLFLSTAAEAGTVGLVLLSLALLRFAFSSSGARPVPLTAVFGIAAGIYLTLAALFSGDYYDSRFIWFFFGLAAIESQRKRATQSAGTPSPPNSVLSPSASKLPT